MANVVFSPPWGVPPTILKNDVLPGITKRGGSYLAKKGLKAYDRKGKQVNASAINSKNYRSYTFRQPPGARNALGEVKFNLPNKWDIYLHDTPHREDFPKRYRAKSSGCVRVERPKDFAKFILAELEGKNFTPEIIDSIIETRHTRFEQLSKKIPVHIIYLTAFEDSNNQHLRLLGDIYHRDAKLIAALQN
jgi:murein L,D-transpeptidase YcbB/YkuD